MADLADLGCCNCFSFLRKRSSVPSRAPRESDGMLSKDLLQRQSTEDDVDEDVDGSFYTGDDPDMSFYNGGDLDGSFYNRDDDPGTSFYDRDGNEYPDGGDNWRQRKTSEELIRLRIEKGQICRGILVRETSKLIRSEGSDLLLVAMCACHLALLKFILDENGTKMINQYIHMGKIGSGSYGKVVLYKSTKDGNLYAVKVFNKAHLEKIHVVRTETAMTDVRREVSIMKILEHPNIVNLVEVIDDPDIDKFYMVLEYVEGKMVCDNGIEEATARSYMRDIISGLMYLHSHNIIHGDIKPDNLLVTSTGNVKIGDFSVSQVFEGNDDMIWRSPGTPVFTAPECCQGSLYRGRPSDTWALGVTLYCMISGRYPFLGDTLQGTYDKILYDAVQTPDNINPHLADLLQRLLCKDPEDRITLQEVAEHPWVVGDLGPITECDCRCGFPRTNKIDFQEGVQ